MYFWEAQLSTCLPLNKICMSCPVSSAVGPKCRSPSPHRLKKLKPNKYRSGTSWWGTSEQLENIIQTYREKLRNSFLVGWGLKSEVCTTRGKMPLEPLVPTIYVATIPFSHPLIGDRTALYLPFFDRVSSANGLQYRSPSPPSSKIGA